MNYQERLFRQRHGYECLPAIPLMALAIAASAASTVASVQGQRYAAQAQERQQGELTKANNFVAGEQMGQLRQQEAQQREATARENEKARLAVQKSRASAMVAAGEVGVSGNSVDALLAEHGMQLGQFREANARQSQMGSSAINTQLESIRTGARFQNLSINAPIAQPNYAAEGVKFVGSVVGAYKDYKSGAFGPTRSTKGA